MSKNNEMNNRVYTGYIYSVREGMDIQISTIDRTYEARRPYLLTLYGIDGSSAGGGLCESWDDALIKSISWRRSAARKDFVSHPEQDVITPDVSTAKQVELDQKLLSGRISKFRSKVRHLMGNVIDIDVDSEGLTEKERRTAEKAEKKSWRSQIAGMNYAASIILDIEIGSEAWEIFCRTGAVK